MKGQISIPAIHRTARGIDKVLSAVVTTAFQQMAKAHQVALDVGRRILQGVTNTGLSGEVHHHLGLLSSKQRHQGITILQSHFREAPGILRGDRLDLTQPRLLQAWVVIVVQVVETDNPVSLLEASESRAAPMKPAAPVTRTVRVINPLRRQRAKGLGQQLLSVQDLRQP